MFTNWGLLNLLLQKNIVLLQNMYVCNIVAIWLWHTGETTKYYLPLLDYVYSSYKENY